MTAAGGSESLSLSRHLLRRRAGVSGDAARARVAVAKILSATQTGSAKKRNVRVRHGISG